MQTELGGEIILHTNPAPLEIVAYKAVTLGNDTRSVFHYYKQITRQSFTLSVGQSVSQQICKYILLSTNLIEFHNLNDEKAIGYYYSYTVLFYIDLILTENYAQSFVSFV